MVLSGTLKSVLFEHQQDKKMDTSSFKGTGKLLALLIICAVLLAASQGFSLAEDQSVTLQWQPSLSNGVVGYNLYRSQTPGSGYQKINSQLIAGTQFTDGNIQPGVEYYYVCRAVTIEGVESVNSNEAIYILEDLNTPPEVADDTVQTDEDTWVDISPLGNDYDSDGDFLEIIGLTQPQQGTAVLSSTTEIRYTPYPDFYGQDSFSYTVTDPGGKESTGSISVQVIAVNDPPQAYDDVLVTDEDTAAEVNLLSNDTDPDNEVLTLVIMQNPANGNVEVLSGGTCIYVPSSNFSGTDTFTYRVSDSSASSTASVSVTVNPVNDSPVASDDSFITNENANGVIQILVNDYDPEGDPLTPVILNQPASGSAVIQADGSVLYTPQPGYSGSDYFTYSVTDSEGKYDSASVSVVISPLAVAFSAVTDSLVVSEDSQVTLNLLSNDQNPENLALTMALQSLPLHGQAQLSQDGLLTYIPNADFYGNENLTYSLTDGEGNTSIASVSIEVSPVNDPPVALGEAASTAEDEPVTIELLLNDSDIDNDPLSASLRSAPKHGTVTILPPGRAVFTPDKNFFGNDSFTYDVSDGSNRAAAEVQISVSPVNDPPDSMDDSISGRIGESVEINVLSNDSDPEGDAISVYLKRAPEHGTVNIQASGKAVYTPSGDFSGSDTFAYRAEDSHGASSSALVNVIVSGENRSPVAEKDNASVTKRSQVVFNVLANDTDPDGDTLELIEISDPANGTALIKTASGDIEYKPESWFRGTDSFTYIVSDGEAVTTGTVNVSVISKPSVLKFSFPSSIKGSKKILQETYIGVGVVNTNKTEENVSFVGFDKTGTTREVIHLGSKLPPQGQLALMTSELGETDESVAQLTAEGESSDVQGFFMVGDITTERLDGVGGVQIPGRYFYFPDVNENDDSSTLIYLINQDSGRIALISAALNDSSGKVIATREIQLAPNGSDSGSIRSLFGDETTVEHGYLRISSSTYVSGYEIVASEKSIYAFSARSPRFSNRLYSPHFIAGEGNNSEIRILSIGQERVRGVVTLMNDQGQTMVSNSITVDPSTILKIDLNSMLSEKYDTSAGLLTGSVLIELDENVDVLSTITMRTAENRAVTAMPLASEGLLDFVFPQVAQSSDGTIFMGFSILNPGSQTANARLSVFNNSGVLTAEKQITLPPLHRLTDLLNGDMLFGPGFSQMGGHIKLVADRPLVSVSIYGDYRGRYLSTVEGQLGEVETAAAAAELERSLADTEAEMEQ
jgi:hypothetical protein